MQTNKKDSKKQGRFALALPDCQKCSHREAERGKKTEKETKGQTVKEEKKKKKKKKERRQRGVLVCNCTDCKLCSRRNNTAIRNIKSE